MPGHTCRAAPTARPAARRCRRSGRLEAGRRSTRGIARTASRSTSCTLAPNAAHGTRSGWVRAVVDLCSPHVQPSIARSSHQRSCSTSARRSTSSSVNATRRPSRRASRSGNRSARACRGCREPGPGTSPAASRGARPRKRASGSSRPFPLCELALHVLLVDRFGESFVAGHGTAAGASSARASAIHRPRTGAACGRRA